LQGAGPGAGFHLCRNPFGLKIETTTPVNKADREKKMPHDSTLHVQVARAFDAILYGTYQVQSGQLDFATEIVKCRPTKNATIDLATLSNGAVELAKLICATNPPRFEFQHSSAQKLPVSEAQIRLFELFSDLLSAYAGLPVREITDLDMLKDIMGDRLRDNLGDMAEACRRAANELADFYRDHAAYIYQDAQQLGGVKLMMGGQNEHFRQSKLAGARISALYGDTQLIPDPVYQYFLIEKIPDHLNMDVVISLFFLLQLQPLVQAALTIPPILVFQNINLAKESYSLETQVGRNEHTISVVAPLCNATISTIEELLEYAIKSEDHFLTATNSSGLFVPAGAKIGAKISVDDGLRMHIDHMRRLGRSDAALKEFSRAPRGAQVLLTMLEQIQPVYHMNEMAYGLGAQPLLTNDLHWHYYEKCAQGTAKSLANKKILSEEALQCVRSLQDDSLDWLANVAIHELIHLYANEDHRLLRSELKQYTAQLTSAGAATLDEVVREVRFGLKDLIKKQKKTINDLKTSYDARRGGAIATGAASIVTGSAVMMVPSLAAVLGTAAAGLGVAAMVTAFGANAASQRIEAKAKEKTLLGVLARAYRPD
jgi:hypothetical protein